MDLTNAVTIGLGSPAEGGQIVDGGGGTAVVQRNLTGTGARFEVDPDDAAPSIEAAHAALPAMGGDIHLWGDGSTDWDVAGGAGPGIVLSKPNTRVWFHGVRLTTSGGATRGFVVHAPRCGFLMPQFRSASQAQAAYYFIRFEESVGSQWDCSGGFVLGGTFEFGAAGAAQAAFGAITAVGAGTGMQGLWIAGNTFIGLPGVQQSTIPHVSAGFHGYVPLSLSLVDGFTILANQWRAERLTVDANPAGLISAGAWIRDCRWGCFVANNMQSYQGAAADATRGPGVLLDRISTAEAHHTVVALNNTESAGFEGFLDMAGARFNLAIGNLIGRNLGASYGMRARVDSQTGAPGETAVFVGNQVHNVDEDQIAIDGCTDVLIVGNLGTIMHSGRKLVGVASGLSNVNVDPHSNFRRFKNNPT
jgi:hypothetical protein